MFKTIMVASDGSECSDRGLALAGSLAESQSGSARVVLVHVREMIAGTGRGGAYPLELDEAGLRSKIDGQVEDLRARGITAELIVHTVRNHGPAAEIADAALAVGADLIVIGSRGHSLLSEMVLGGVTMRLLPAAPCPVLVVPPMAVHAGDGTS